jgi:catechol 2,3-dioxygenase-like lactoylglutathione lyase family enzyme
MASVQGIGGVFIDSDDASRLASWYEEMLGIKMESHPDGIGYYRVFFTRDAETSIMRSNPVFAINQAKTRLPEGERGYMINFRVDHLDSYLEKLRTKGVAIEDNIQEWEYGKHAWIRDLDGNRVELYEELFPEKPG